MSKFRDDFSGCVYFQSRTWNLFLFQFIASLVLSPSSRIFSLPKFSNFFLHTGTSNDSNFLAITKFSIFSKFQASTLDIYTGVIRIINGPDCKYTVPKLKIYDRSVYRYFCRWPFSLTGTVYFNWDRIFYQDHLFSRALYLTFQDRLFSHIIDHILLNQLVTGSSSKVYGPAIIKIHGGHSNIKSIYF